MKISIKKLSSDVILPQQMKKGDAGIDLRSIEKYILKPGERKLFKTGISLAIPEGYYGRIAPRSGFAYRQGIDVLGGVIDANYRGDIGIILINLGQESFSIDPGMRIAQLIIQPCEYIERRETNSLNDTERGDAGFGSTGI